jgi:hypothetical protein
MSYFSNTDDQSLGSWLGCGSGCNCGPCKSSMGGFDEWYEKEEADEPAEVTPPSAPSPSQSPPGANPQAGSLKGWSRSGIGLGNYAQTGPSLPGAGPQTSSNEQAVLQDAFKRGIRNPRRLSNIIFFARHPSRGGIPLQANEVGLIAEWWQIRERIVLPALRQMFAPRYGAIRRRVVRPPGSRNY